MVTTISLMVRGRKAGREYSPLLLYTLFLVGGTAGGVIAGFLLASVASLFHAIAPSSDTTFMAAALVVTLAFAGELLGLYRLPHPQSPYQVPRAWRDAFPPPVTSFIYSAGLGFAFLTRVSAVAFYGMVALLLAFGGTPTTIVASFAIYGFVKAAVGVIPVAVASSSGDTQLLERIGYAWPIMRAVEFSLMASASALILSGLLVSK